MKRVMQNSSKLGDYFDFRNYDNDAATLASSKSQREYAFYAKNMHKYPEKQEKWLKSNFNCSPSSDEFTLTLCFCIRLMT